MIGWKYFIVFDEITKRYIESVAKRGGEIAGEDAWGGSRRHREVMPPEKKRSGLGRIHPHEVAVHVKGCLFALTHGADDRGRS